VTLLAGALTPQVQCPLIRMRFPPECTAIYPSNPCPWRTHLISGPAVRRRDPTCGSLDARVQRVFHRFACNIDERMTNQTLTVCEELEEEETAEDEIEFDVACCTGTCFFFW